VLAYVFWHAPAGPTAEPSYRADLLDFHASLANDPTEGFVGSSTVELTDASWLAGWGECFEDWYLVEDWAAVGALNHGAVAPAHLASHDRVAHRAGFGGGAIYALQSGEPAASYPYGSWFSKPPGTSYAELWASLASATEADCAVWQRQLVLGPSPEFCLRSHVPPRLPEELAAERIHYEPAAAGR
jgi:hypothetical protein